MYFTDGREPDRQWIHANRVDQIKETSKLLQVFQLFYLDNHKIWVYMLQLVSRKNP